MTFYSPMPTFHPFSIPTSMTLSTTPILTGQNAISNICVLDGSYIPQGQVFATVDGNPSVSDILSASGCTSFTWIGLSAGTHPITAIYPNQYPYEECSQIGSIYVSSDGADSVALSDLVKIYNGSIQYPTVTTTPPGLSYAVTGFTNAGTNGVAAQINQPGWQTSYATGTMTINKADQTITFPALPNLHVGDPLYTPPASASSGLAVSYTSDNPVIATISGNKIKANSAGTCNIIADQGGDPNWNAAPSASQPLTVLP